MPLVKPPELTEEQEQKLNEQIDKLNKLEQDVVEPDKKVEEQIENQVSDYLQEMKERAMKKNMIDSHQYKPESINSNISVNDKNKEKSKLFIDDRGHKLDSNNNCVICKLSEDKLTSRCFGRPVFKSTLMKMESGMRLDYDGNYWYELKQDNEQDETDTEKKEGNNEGN